MQLAQRFVTLLALTGALSGCAANALDRMGDALPAMPSMASMPSMPDMPSMSNLLGRKPAKDPVEVPIFVASTRSAQSKANIRRAGGEGSANFSMLSVSVPPNHAPGLIEQPSFGRPDKRSHFVLMDERPLSREEYTRQIASQLAGRVGSSRDILIFVHGYNTGAEEARRRLAQIVADSHFAGVAVLFNWPTRGELSAYVSDKDSATASRDALSRLFVDLSQTPSVGRVHVLAHSMGAWLGMEALREASISGHQGLDGRLGEVMLAAPDIDLAVFRQQLSKLGNVHVSVFTSAGDRALSLSSLIARDRPRVGALDPRKPNERLELTRLGVTVYDLSGLSSGLIGHDVYADAPEVIRLIGNELSRTPSEETPSTPVAGANGETSQSAQSLIRSEDLPPPNP
jgi:esterase/lipase superfamily enzyme